MSWIDAAIWNARSGYCMCGGTVGVQRGQSPFGYGPCCVDCQRAWEEKFGMRWKSEAQMHAEDDAHAARLAAVGIGRGEIIDRRNRRLAPFERRPA